MGLKENCHIYATASTSHNLLSGVCLQKVPGAVKVRTAVSYYSQAVDMTLLSMTAWSVTLLKVRPVHPSNQQ
jgi:hypothetical protein